MSTEKNNRPANMTDEDNAALSAAGEKYNNATTDEERVAAHAEAEAIRNKYNYSGGADGSKVITTNRTDEEARQQSYIDVIGEASKVGNKGLSDAAANALKNSLTPEVPEVAPVTSQLPDFTGLLNQWLETANKQNQNQIDYATQQGVKELERAEQDAQEQFQTQQNQIDVDEAKALDNQALYAEARGDRGGIGQAQYGQIQATAMTNRRAVNSARTKLSTDTARAIADLRAQGEFQKADALLQNAQTYLAKLTELQQWGAEYALSVEQFNAQLQQWQAEFDMQDKQWQTEFDYSVSWNDRQLLAEQGMAMLSVGIRPSASQQEAMGYTNSQIDAYLAQYKLAQASGSKSGGSGGSGGNNTSNTPGLNILQTLYAEEVPVGQAISLLIEAGYTATEAEKIAMQYEDNYEVLGEEVAWTLGRYNLESLAKAGYGDASEGKILNAIKTGVLIAEYKNGEIYFRKSDAEIAKDVKNNISNDLAGHGDYITSLFRNVGGN